LLAAVIGVVLISVSLVTVTITGPRVSVRWQATISTANRLALEQSYDLRNGRQDDPQNDLVWRYELGDWSRDAVAALVNDPAVADTHYIDRSSYQVDDPSIVISTRIPSVLRALPFPFSTDNRFESLWFFFHVQSLCLIMVGFALLRVALATSAAGEPQPSLRFLPSRFWHMRFRLSRRSCAWAMPLRL
jgi:hypothetical protein